MVHQDETAITSDDALLTYTVLLPDQISPFKVLSSYNPAMKDFRLTFKEFLGSQILTKRLED